MDVIDIEQISSQGESGAEPCVDYGGNGVGRNEENGGDWSYSLYGKVDIISVRSCGG